MASKPFETTLELSPHSRFDMIDVNRLIATQYGRVLEGFQKVLYCSHHTTAGYLDQRLAERLRDREDGLDPFIQRFQHLFPRDAGYLHDEMRLRGELSEEERKHEPPNGDAHLTFIGSGLQSCVTYRHHTGLPVFFMDLDGVYQNHARNRTTSVVAYNREEIVAEVLTEVPVNRHAIDSVNLSDERLGLNQQIGELLRSHPVECGRLDISLDPGEQAAALTVNEFETLLMRHDLAEVLRDPLRFMARQGRRMLRDPRAVPAKSLGYARYDMVRILNEVIDAFGLSETAVVRLLSRLMAYPAARRLRFKRSLNIPVSSAGGARPQLVKGRYQSPILIQWAATPRRVRTLQVKLSRLL
jgi:thiamine phosphate synthase YjbQ (UPF0047 family)